MTLTVGLFWTTTEEEARSEDKEDLWVAAIVASFWFHLYGIASVFQKTLV